MSDPTRFVPLGGLSVGDPHDVSAVVAAHRRRFLVPVRQPLVLVTQIQRSGGTLITQLLDGHSQLHVHPAELLIGRPKGAWPALDLTKPPAETFEMLREKRAGNHAESGYLKISKAEIARNPNAGEFILPFIFIQSLQERIFAELMELEPPRSQREALDHYATSYFNAWLDYSGLYRSPADVRYWVAFVPRLLFREAGADRFFEDYPDGRLIVPVRDPVSWYASARAHSKGYADLDASVDDWLRCNRNALAAAERYTDRVVFVAFEALVAESRATLTVLLDRLELRFEPQILQPTFNGMPVVSDSSFGSQFGIDRTALDRSAWIQPEEQARLRERTAQTYALLMQRALGSASVAAR